MLTVQWDLWHKPQKTHTYTQFQLGIHLTLILSKWDSNIFWGKVFVNGFAKFSSDGIWATTTSPWDTITLMRWYLCSMCFPLWFLGLCNCLISAECYTFKPLNLHMLCSWFCYNLMFCIVFVFSCILQVLEENPSNSKIITKSANSLLKRFNSKSILNLRKEKSAKFVFFGKNPEWACLCNLTITFISSIGLWWNWRFWQANRKWNKYVRNVFFLIQMFTMPKFPATKDHKSVRIWNHFPTCSGIS
jgi:hypothetical protein